MGRDVCELYAHLVIFLVRSVDNMRPFYRACGAHGMDGAAIRDQHLKDETVAVRQHLRRNKPHAGIRKIYARLVIEILLCGISVELKTLAVELHRRNIDRELLGGPIKLSSLHCHWLPISW